MKTVVIVLIVLSLALTCGSSCARGDIAIEMKSSLSGIPFMQMFEIYQTHLIKGDLYAISSELELGVADTTIQTKSLININTENRHIVVCQWEDSSCIDLDFSVVESLLQSGITASLLDSLEPYIDSIRKYVKLKPMDFELTGETQNISGYNCQELLFDMEGEVSPPIKEMPGSFKFKVDGTSWVTTDIPKYDEYKKSLENMQAVFFTPAIRDLINTMIGYLGLDESFLQTYLDYSLYIWVQSAINMTVELWTPEMSMPSMSFNLRFNSVLLDISYDKIPEQAFQKPVNFRIEDLNLKKFFESL